MTATVLLATLLAASPTPLAVGSPQSDRPVAVDVPAMAADSAVNRLAAQADVDVVIAIDLSRRRTPALRGRLSVQQAFRLLLEPLGARAVEIRPGVYRVETSPSRRAVPLPRRPTPRPETALPVELDEIVVTAPIGRGGVEGTNGRSVIGVDALTGRSASGSASAVADLSATVDSTRQGSGRNRLFVRGIADSTLSGPLQTTIGQYLGDFRLSYSAPDPDLALVDLERIEVFEGPQGTRFGSGSIGGVVRLQPAPPDPDYRGGSLEASAALTPDGAPGGHAALVLNQPTGPASALRLSAWGRREGGFLSNPVRGSDHDDAIDSRGARLSWRMSREDWTFDALALVQALEAGDAQLVRSAGDRETDRPLAEPYTNDFGLVGVALNRRGQGWQLSAAGSVSRQSLSENFDASVPEVGQFVLAERRQSVSALSSETRLEFTPNPRATFNIGLSWATADTDVARARTYLAPIGPAPETARLDRRLQETAIFGDVILRPWPTLAITAGGRVAHIRVENRLLSLDPDIPVQDTRSTSSDTLASPMIGLRWSRTSQFAVFARIEQGFRSPGVGEAATGFGPAYGADRVTLWELGAGWGAPDANWSVSVSAGLMDWRDIQSDVITIGGDLATANIGDGRIDFLQLRGDWRPLDRVSISGSVFLNDSRLTLAGFGTIGASDGDIPNVAPVSGQASVDLGPFVTAAGLLEIGLDLRYVGRSTPGLGAVLSTPQGGYLDADATVRLGDERRALILGVSNLFDVEATRFGIGSPYRLSDPYVAPVRPLTVTIGVEARF